MSTERRRFLKMAGWAGATLLVAGPSLVIGRLEAATRPAFGAARTTRPMPTASPVASSAQSATPAATASASPSAATGTLLAKGSQLASSPAVTAVDPATGDPVLVIKLPSGSVVAYDAVCTHAGCTVEYDPGSVTLICPCHGAQFDPAQHARVMGGPTFTPLAAIPIRVDPRSGDVTTTA